MPIAYTAMQYYVAILMATLSFCEVGYGSFTAEEGPYEIIVHNTSDCLPKQHPGFYANISAFTSRGRRLLRGTTVVKRDHKDLKFRIRLYYMNNNKMVKAFEIKNQNCHNVIVNLILRMVGQPFNPVRCVFKSGTVTFNNLDVNRVVHSVVQSIWYGDVTVRWEVAAATTDIPLMCLDVSLTSAKPANT